MIKSIIVSTSLSLLLIACCPETTPPPVAYTAPAPAPALARTYLVFFDWNKADLTTRAKEIVDEAAVNSTKLSVTQIEVDGNADTSGNPAYNLKLSQRRAESVAAELVRQGVSANEIFIQAFGDTKPLVATGPGVREAQNRRVEIILK
jgi:OOP family OmpA-OmpF porin